MQRTTNNVFDIAWIGEDFHGVLSWSALVHYISIGAPSLTRISCRLRKARRYIVATEQHAWLIIIMHEESARAPLSGGTTRPTRYLWRYL